MSEKYTIKRLIRKNGLMTYLVCERKAVAHYSNGDPLVSDIEIKPWPDLSLAKAHKERLEGMEIISIEEVFVE